MFLLKTLRISSIFGLMCAIALLFSTTLLGSQGSMVKAQTNSSCTTLLTGFHNDLVQSNKFNTLEAIEVTNFQSESQHWGAFTNLTLDLGDNGHFIGANYRIFTSEITTHGSSTIYPAPLTFSNDAEFMRYDIDPVQGTLTITAYEGTQTKVYGPTQMTCTDQFAQMTDGTYFTTLTFKEVYISKAS